MVGATCSTPVNDGSPVVAVEVAVGSLNVLDEEVKRVERLVIERELGEWVELVDPVVVLVELVELVVLEVVAVTMLEDDHLFLGDGVAVVPDQAIVKED